MKYITLVLAVALLTACQANGQLKPVSQIKPGVAQEGSLANTKLIGDTTNALMNLPNNYRISPDAQILKFVIQQPVGSVGERTWREMWVAKNSDSSKSYIITFTEKGLGAADYAIEPMNTK